NYTGITLSLRGELVFRPDMFKERVMELNASDERGINVIRTKVKAFSQVTAAAKPNGYDDAPLLRYMTGLHRKYPCPPYKLVVLDEADSMTAEAQVIPALGGDIDDIEGSASSDD